MAAVRRDFATSTNGELHSSQRTRPTTPTAQPAVASAVCCVERYVGVALRRAGGYLKDSDAAEMVLRYLL